MTPSEEIDAMKPTITLLTALLLTSLTALHAAAHGRVSTTPVVKTTESQRSIATQASEENARISATNMRLILAPISPGDTPEFSGVAAR